MTTVLGLLAIAVPSAWFVSVCRQVRHASRCRLLREAIR